ncbi:hypothetical protein [Cochleicola gelatinilyticus]|uniref:Phage abortive infection protein n=1 Tax=Cochleicola gelatinilyticus TaxID=1763537 RepID=A0A167HM21_9FLAO|nr:hypothetical protein [Cochleicola gelatinilyticus]OAB78758.1 hypothetical protein ULVI_09255 [Cochleicola gelatinilyticus]
MKNNYKDFKFWISIGIPIIIILWLSTALILYNNLSSVDRGTFGDMFGSINALFSGFALFGIILTIILQQKDLKDTREEFKYSRLTTLIFKKYESINNDINNYIIQYNKDYNLESTSPNISLEFIANEFIPELDESISTQIKELRIRDNDFLVWTYGSIYKYIINRMFNESRLIKTLLHQSNINDENKDELIFIFAQSIDNDVFKILRYFEKSKERDLRFKEDPINPSKKYKPYLNFNDFQQKSKLVLEMLNQN